MGLNFIARGHGLEHSCDCSRHTSPIGAIRKPDITTAPPNPNPLNFKIERVKQMGIYLGALVYYPDCTNFEGKKIIVLKGVTETELRNMRQLDPHFLEAGPIIARFRPDAQGWENALCLMRILSGKRRA